MTVGAHTYMAAVPVELPQEWPVARMRALIRVKQAEFVARFRQGRLVTVRSSHVIDLERPGLVVAEVEPVAGGLLIHRPRRRYWTRTLRPAPPVEDVDPGAACQAVGAGAAQQAVAPGAARQAVGAGLAEQPVRAGAALERVGAGAAADQVVAAEGLDHVVAAQAHDHVGLGRAPEPVAAVAADHRRRPAGAARRGRPGEAAGAGARAAGAGSGQRVALEAQHDQVGVGVGGHPDEDAAVGLDRERRRAVGGAQVHRRAPVAAEGGVRQAVGLEAHHEDVVVPPGAGVRPATTIFPLGSSAAEVSSPRTVRGRKPGSGLPVDRRRVTRPVLTPPISLGPARTIAPSGWTATAGREEVPVRGDDGGAVARGPNKGSSVPWGLSRRATAKLMREGARQAGDDDLPVRREGDPGPDIERRAPRVRREADARPPGAPGP